MTDARLYLYREQIKVLTQSPVISALGLLLKVDVSLQLILILPCSPIYSL